ncbi:tropomodulin-1 isoform X2 [Hydra vulgaris]|uniref:Tropomodulin-1 isoform X2 n=1 Tax=Hydra vulgaris TaxID=6087 RepID=A0ABM4CFR5_HYDVU
MKDLYEDDELLTGLSKEELDEFNRELNDPENELLPASQRAPDQTLLEPTGDFDREHLLTYLKEEALASENIEDFVPFEKKTRGRVWKAKEKKKSPILLLPDDLSDVLDMASEDDLIELAAVLGIHGMLNQKQSEQMEADKAWDSLKGSGLKKYKGGITKATKTKQYTDINAINELDLDKALTRLTSFDETLTELNLNNHKDITVEKLTLIADNLKENKFLKTLLLANTQMTDSVCKLFAEALIVNKTLESINLESNYLTRDGVSELLKMLEVNKSLKELRLDNQSQMMGHQLETKICKVLAKNQTLLRFGFTFQSRGPRHIANKYLMRNNDADRLVRQSEKLEKDSELKN